MEDWSIKANCKGHTDDFYAIDTPSARRGKAKILITAISFCQTCSVSSECLMYACNTEQEYGIWASFTPDQIQKIIKVNETVTSELASMLISLNITTIKETYNV